MRYFAVAALMVVMLSLPILAEAAVKDDYMIVPGVRIGVLSVGMSPDAAVTAMQHAHNALPQRDQRSVAESMAWRSLGLYASFYNGRALQIVTRSGRYRTRTGLRVGISYRDARRRQGVPQTYEQYGVGDVAYWKGMEVEIQRGVITSIAVAEP